MEAMIGPAVGPVAKKKKPGPFPLGMIGLKVGPGFGLGNYFGRTLGSGTRRGCVLHRVFIPTSRQAYSLALATK